MRIVGYPVTISIGVAQMIMGERTPEFAQERVARALAKARQYGGNQVQAAKLLGITRATLRKRLERFGITRELVVQ